MEIFPLRFLKILFVVAVLAGAVFIPEAALGQLRFRDVTMDQTTLPRAAAVVRAVKGAQPVVLTDKNFFIIDDNRYSQAVSISAPDANGFQRVEWFSQLRSSDYVKFLLSESNETVDTIMLMGSLPFIAFFRFQGQETRINEVKFGNVAAGVTASQNLRIKVRGGQEALVIERVETGTQFFKAEWKGGWGVPSQLPGELASGLPANVEVSFTPSEDKYYSDILTIYYSGGAKDQIPLYGNKLELEEKTVLRLLSPNGGEILAPCSEFVIRWSGHVQQFPTIVEYSNNNGTSWVEIKRVSDSSYVWRVPDDISDSVRVRVRQEFQRSAEGVLNAEQSEAHALGFSADGTAFLTAHANGKITEWNAEGFQKIRTLDVSPVGSVEMAGTGYGREKTTVVAAYTLKGTGQNTSTLVLFKNGSNSPTSEIQLPQSFRLKKMLSDPLGRFFAMIPQLGREALLYDDEGNLLKTIQFDAPVTSANINASGVIITLLNGIVAHYNLPDFSLKTSLNFPFLPIILQAAISPDGAFAAVATQAPTGIDVARESEVFIIDIASNSVIRHLSAPKSLLASEPRALSFNATGRSLVLGYAANPRVSLWNFSKEDDTPPYSDYSDLSLNLSGDLTDVSFGPDGRFAIASARSALSGNLIYRRFTYPEADMSDAMFRIVPPVAQLNVPSFPDTYLGARNPSPTTAIFCNTSEASIILESANLKFGYHFSQVTPFLKDTLQPGECLNLEFAFVPRDTGIIRDTLTITTCSRTFVIALEARSLARNILLVANNTDFGELCVGASTERDLAFIKNNDPVPLTINSLNVFDIFTSGFSILTPIVDTILQPGEMLAVRVKFQPKKLGEDRRDVIIRHSNQEAITSRLTLVGTGIGTDIQAVGAFPFIPEILNRKLTLKNNSPNTITITKADLEPNGAFTVVTPLPMDIPANSEGEVEITWNGQPTGDVLLKIQSAPCGSEKTVILREFKGTSTVSVPTVEADAYAKNVQIPVRFKNNDNTTYAGQRFFEAEVLVNPRLFLAESVTSEFGEATFTQNVVNGKRVIHVRVEGDFKGEGVAAVIHGIAGLAETLESPIEFNSTSVFWGSAVSVSTQPGLLKITGAGSRRVIQPNITAQIMAIFPNPARENITLEIEAETASAAILEVYNALGEKLAEAPADLLKGRSRADMNVSQLPAGTYRVVLKTADGIVSSTLLNVAR
ncbi:MAG TPA: T9SS type A sorting domain-containing protein [Patescibacteria group bacterium]|nr:T9SS type A sorting domain-containing protein [Patescibacteria group bacterium]